MIAETLNDSDVGELSGVGPKTAPLFRELGIETARALLEYLPFRYDDLRFPTPAVRLGEAGSEENAVGRVTAVKERRVRGLEIVDVQLVDLSGDRFAAKWIGRNRYVYGRFREGMRLFVRGRVERNFSGPVVNVTQHASLAEGQEYHGELVPIYRASKDLPSRKIAAVVKKNLSRLLELSPQDPLPASLAAARRYPSARDAYRAVHAPDTPEEARDARERFVFAEFLGLATAAQLRRTERERDHDARALRVPPDLLERLEATLPFALTAAQRKVILEIWADMRRDVPMNRLLQGDVGSGKTLVAAAAVLLAAANGMQSALMAPTELLAWQHASKLAPLLLPFGLGVEALFGSQGSRSRAAALEKLASGEAALAVGTHALLEARVDFDRLGLAIIDEQHRFGVEQRARLRAKALSPHTLHMTATPIPRTLAQSAYADLDLSTIDELPPGRKPIETFAVRASRLERVYEFVRKNVAAGHQAYIIAPAIDEGDAGLTSAVAEADRLKAKVFSDLRLGLLHGRLASREKEETMARFVRGELDVLVSTTVVEVGVDVANATVMVVLDAHRYGLAQLHQLRGRVGRGAAKSFCVLVYPDDDGDRERLEILTQCNDGFRIADEDLRLRGPGQLAGTVQSGAADLRFGDLLRDIDVYRAAKAAAQTIVTQDPQLAHSDHAGLRTMLATQPSTRALVISS
ncbi:MAG TPA: ATP-dependent DNA helicase RecG [Candidatus Cybelea sp.]|jgi:ATP-dependent DNA helicase RecG|nr:ATP-dependent DNA helicase RecG [Candidatus Cybelea sp.]